MSDRPRLLDLYCGAGGAAMGYHRAGFDVVGVDIEPQPRYPFECRQADALTFPLDGFDVIHASPPCHDHSALAHVSGLDGTGWQLTEMLNRLRSSGKLWVVENVGNAKLPPDIWQAVLCGSAFNLGVRRHRRFASNVLLLVPQCAHKRQGMPIGVYGYGGPTKPVRSDGTTRRGYQGSAEERREAMGIDWMRRKELSQAIPPAYTEHVGTQLLAALA